MEWGREKACQLAEIRHLWFQVCPLLASTLSFLLLTQCMKTSHFGAGLRCRPLSRTRLAVHHAIQSQRQLPSTAQVYANTPWYGIAPMAFGMYEMSRLDLVLDIDMARFLDATVAGSAAGASDSLEETLLSFAMCWPPEICSCCTASTDAVWLAMWALAVLSV